MSDFAVSTDKYKEIRVSDTGIATLVAKNGRKFVYRWTGGEESYSD